MKNNKKNTSRERLQSTIKVFLMFSMAIFMVSFISAYSISLDFNFITQKQNTCFNIPAACDNCTYINITVLYSNGTSIIENQAMSSSSGYYYNYTFCNTTILGNYMIITHYDEDRTYPYSETNFFEVTPTGNLQTESQGILSVGILASVLLLMLFFGWLSFKFIESNEMFGIGLFFLVMSLILSLYSLFLGYIFSRDYLFTSVSDVQEGVFISGLFGLTGIMFIAFTFLIVKVIKELKIKKTKEKHGEGYNTKTKMYDY